ncbi:MAG: glycine betaine ABC transporter substrate-binding protein [Atribacterota bacterium]|nr:glycine betaine ABC transporter substrate-binding protein [Atribacterota bacterium]
MKKIIKIITLTFLLIMIVNSFVFAQTDKRITVGSKDFTESYVLGDIISQLLKHHGFRVEEKFGMAAAIARSAILNRQIDILPDYTGTALGTYFESDENINDPVELYETVKKLDLEKNNLVWMGRTSFNNTYALAIKKDMIDEIGTTISDLAEYVNKKNGQVTFAVNHTFYQRESDGIFPMAVEYNMNIVRENVKPMDTGLTYTAIDRGQVDVAMVFGTDAKLRSFDLFVLEDDKHFFPIYNVSLVVRKEVFDRFPEIEEILKPITEIIDTEMMINLNYEVDANGLPTKMVADQFLKQHGLID